MHNPPRCSQSRSWTTCSSTMPDILTSWGSSRRFCVLRNKHLLNLTRTPIQKRTIMTGTLKSAIMRGMILASFSNSQSENDLDSIRNSSDVFVSLYIFIYKDFYSFVFSRTSISPQPQQGSLLCSAIFASEHIVSWVRQSTTFSVNKLISVFINFREIYHRSCYPLPIHPKNSFKKKRKCRKLCLPRFYF